MKKRAVISKSNAPLFLGLDSSTQGLQAVVLNKRAQPVYEETINYDRDLPAYKTMGGVHRHADGLTVTAPPLMWVEALDLLLTRAQKAGAPLGQIAAISGSGQQHGSVYLKKEALKLLRALDPRKKLVEQLRKAFAVQDSPVWMDSSTSRECRAREQALGGPQATAELTGSRAFERFTGNQIAKIYRKRPAAYQNSHSIALVSSFMASLCIGDYAPIEPADGAGMNLMDIRARDWAPKALACTAPRLKSKLPPIVPSHTVIGNISPYYCERYGFAPDCQVVAFTGDNPSSLAALGLESPGEIAISLGTSDTIFGALAEPRPSATEGHIFGNPINPRAYMALLCYKNGSLTREYVRDQAARASWAQFEKALQAEPQGNLGRIGFYFKEPEITPPVLQPGIHRFGADDRPIKSFPATADARAVVEGQFLSMRLHAANIGLVPAKILATGGASVNKSILQVMADVIGAPVYVGRHPGSAALGAAYRALHGYQCARAGRMESFAQVIKISGAFQKACNPRTSAHKIYSAMLKRYAALEKKLIGE